MAHSVASRGRTRELGVRVSQRILDEATICVREGSDEARA